MGKNVVKYHFSEKVHTSCY